MIFSRLDHSEYGSGIWAGRLSLAAVLALAAAPGLVGCLLAGGADRPGSASQDSRSTWQAPWQRTFPDPATVARWAQAPAELPEIATGIHMVDSWPLPGPFPEAPGATPRPPAALGEPWSEFLATRTRSNDATITEEMTCTARHAGLFVLAHGARPSDDLLDVMSSRCGALAVGLVATFAVLDDDRARSDEETFAQWEPVLTRAIRIPRQRHQVAGIFFGRDRGRAAVVVVSGADRAEVSAAPRRPDERGHLVIRGTLRDPAAQARGAITVDRYRTEPCRLDPAVQLPDFVMTCTPSRSDRRARIEMVAFAPSRPYGVTALRMDLWPSEPPGADVVYRRPVYEAAGQAAGRPTGPMSPEDDLRFALRDAVNAIRADAGLAPLVLAPAQSQLATRLAPRYLTEVYGITADERQTPGSQAPGSPSSEDIALGLMAGWDVPGTVYRSGFTMAVSGAPDAGVLLGSIASSPFGRRVLFDPGAHFLALGPVVKNGAAASLVATYAVVEQVDRRAVVARALATVERRRGERGLSSSGHLDEARRIIADAAKRLESGRLDPDSAAAWLLSQTGELRAHNTWAWTLAVPEPGPFPFPEQLFERDRIRVAAALTTYRPPGDAWASFVLIVVAAGD